MRRKLDMEIRAFREVNPADAQSGDDSTPTSPAKPAKISTPTPNSEWGKAPAPVVQSPVQIPGEPRTLTTRKGLSVETTYTDLDAQMRLLKLEDRGDMKMTPFVQAMCDRVRVEFIRMGRLTADSHTKSSEAQPYQRVSGEQIIWVHILVVGFDKRTR